MSRRCEDLACHGDSTSARSADCACEFLICHLDTSLVLCARWSQCGDHIYFSIATTHAMPPPRKQMHDLSSTTPWPARHRKMQKQPALLLQANQPTKAISYPSEEKLVRYGIPRPSCGQPHPCELHLVDRRPGDTVTAQRMMSLHRCGKSAAKVIG